MTRKYARAARARAKKNSNYAQNFCAIFCACAYLRDRPSAFLYQKTDFLEVNQLCSRGALTRLNYIETVKTVGSLFCEHENVIFNLTVLRYEILVKSAPIFNFTFKKAK